jgi:hypothetical protein
MSGTTKSITGITLSNQQISAASAPGTQVATVTVTLSDGQSFTGDLAISGVYLQGFAIKKTRQPYNISSIHLSNATVASGQPIGTAVGDISVTDDDGLPFSGSFVLDDAVNFTVSGSSIITNAILTAGNYPLKITAVDAASVNQQLSINVQISATVSVPGPPALAFVSATSSSLTVSLTLPTTGAPISNGNIQLQYKASTSGLWLNATPIPYATPNSGSFTDAFTNVWSLNSSNHPVVNGTTDTVSNANLLLLSAGSVYQRDLAGNWYQVTPTARISGTPNWAGPVTSPLTSITQSGLSASTSYDFQAFVSTPAGNGATSTTLTQSTNAASQTGGPGPVATSPGNFLVVDYGSPMNYPSGGFSGQIVVDRMLWGASGGAFGDNNFQMMADPATIAAGAKINAGLLFFKNSSQQYWNNDANFSVNQSVLANLVNNFQKWDPLSVAKCMIGVDFGGGSGPQQVSFLNTPAKYAQAMANLVSYLTTVRMPNGNPFPLMGITGEDEPNSGSLSILNQYYSALVPAIRNVNPNILIAGPTGSDDTIFTSPISGLDIFSWNNFYSGGIIGATDMGPVNSPLFSSATSRASSEVTGTAVKAFMMMGYAIDFDAHSPAEESFVGAMCVAEWNIDRIDNANRPFYAGWWQMSDRPGFASGTADLIRNGQISPAGYMMAQGSHKLYGTRWNTPTNSAGLHVMALCPGSGMASVLIVNSGRGTQTNKQIALSRWPVNTSGNGQATVWQMSNNVLSRGIDGTVSVKNVTAGVIDAITFPDPSVTVISVGL